MLRFMYENSGMDYFISQNNGFLVFYDLEDVAKPLSIIKEQMDEIWNCNLP